MHQSAALRKKNSEIDELYKTAVGFLNVNPNDFWNITPREINILLEANEIKQREELNKLIFLAWQIEVFHRTKKLRPLKRYLIREPQKQLSKEEIEREKEALKKIFKVAV